MLSHLIQGINPFNTKAFSSKAQEHRKFWKSLNPCHVGLHWKALAEYSKMSTHLPGFQSFSSFFRIILYEFKELYIATSSTRVKFNKKRESNVILICLDFRLSYMILRYHIFFFPGTRNWRWPGWPGLFIC